MVTNTNHQEQTSALTQESTSQQEKTPELTSEQMQGANMRALEKVEKSNSVEKDSESLQELQNLDIPKPDLRKMAKIYKNQPVKFVKAVLQHYYQAMKGYNISQRAKNIATEKYIARHFKIGIKINSDGTVTTLSSGRGIIDSGVYEFYRALIDAKNMQDGKKALNHIKVRAGIEEVRRKRNAANKTTKNNPKPASVKKEKLVNVETLTIKVFGKTWKFKMAGNSLTANTGLYDNKVGHHGYNYGDIDITSLLAAFGAAGADSDFKKGKALLFYIKNLSEYIKHAINVKIIDDDIKVNLNIKLSFNLSHYTNAVLGLNKLKKKVDKISNKEEKELITEIINATIEAQGKYLPHVDHEVYKIIQNKPFYKPSTKHFGYFVIQDHLGNYFNEDEEFTTFYKIDYKSGKMVDAGFLNRKK